MDFQLVLNYLTTKGLDVLSQIAGAIIVLFIGRWVIRIIVNLSRKALTRQIPEATLSSYLGTLLSVLLHIGLIIGILGYFGVETTTFAALLAGVGLAIGTAWGGLLANFAAGVFLVALRPFRVGDTVTAASVTGTVREIGMFMTKIYAADNTIIYVGNNKIFSENIHNHTMTEYRRVEAKLTLLPEVNSIEVMNKINEKLASIPNVLPDPKPEVGILEVTREGTTITVRPYAEVKNFQRVLYDTNRMIVELLNQK